MEEIHQSHLTNVLSFLHRRSTETSFKILKNAIQIQLHRNKQPTEAERRKKLAVMCTHCFTYWKEGRFSVKFKPKYKSGRNISKRMILKCLVCNHKEYQPYEYHATNFCSEKGKIQPVVKKSDTSFKSKSKKNTKITQPTGTKKTKNSSSRLTKSSQSKTKRKKKINR